MWPPLCPHFYHARRSPSSEAIHGHAAYTKTNALLFNTTEIVKALYSSVSQRGHRKPGD
jgi:hypothetical protein